MSVTSILLACLPLVLLFAGWWGGRPTMHDAGKTLSRLCALCLALYAAALGTAFLLPVETAQSQIISQSPLSLIMVGLVLFIANILVAYSRNYMAGEQRIGVYWRWLLFTLAAVTLVVLSNHLLLFWLGWIAISLALHRLLTFYPDRPRAVLAAHKKFLLARSAELLLLVAIVLLYQQHGTFYISDLLAHFQAVAADPELGLSLSEQIAAVLIATVALIKCAQLPIHGWLMQVVEAPTPISALLHAGVINLGGFLLILFAPLFMQVPAAQWLVLVVAGLTTVIAALVMTTRISIKVRLAWSTSAQMGLMLLECALGLFELALLHLVTHSAYKAYAFLNSGSAVMEHMQRNLAPAAKPKLWDWFMSAGISALLLAPAIYWYQFSMPWSVWLLLGFALTMLMAQRHSSLIRSNILPIAALAVALVASYSLLKTIFALAVPTASGYAVDPLSVADLWAITLFMCLFFCNWLLRFHAQRPSVQKLSIALFAGLYLDEWLTRLTLKVWPVRLPKGSSNKVLNTAKA